MASNAAGGLPASVKPVSSSTGTGEGNSSVSSGAGGGEGTGGRVAGVVPRV
jgi:hypothetical protein